MINHIVVSALIKSSEGDRFYIQQRSEGKEFAGKWELPGGKVEDGETFESALIRELEEELRPIQNDNSDGSDFYIKNFIGATVKISPSEGAWAGQSYLLMFFEVRLDQRIKPSANFLWLGKNQVEAFRDKLLPEDLEVIMEQFCESKENQETLLSSGEDQTSEKNIQNKNDSQ
jgi:hypothetical protein